MAVLRARIAEMQAMARTIESLAARCHGDDRPDCPIMDELSIDPNVGRDGEGGFARL